MDNIYIDGRYLKQHPSWDVEDSYWKAKHIINIIKKHNITCQKVADIGCGAGGVLFELSKLMDGDITFYGYDISPQAIGLAQKHTNARLSFHLENLFSDNNSEYFDILLIMDVLEHVPDYLNFAKQCQRKAKYKIYHIPLDISVYSILKRSYIGSRHQHGHLHYFTFESAIEALKDTNHKIIDFFYTDTGTYYFKKYPTFKNAMTNLPKWLLAYFNIALAVRIFGRYSLLLLTE